MKRKLLSAALITCVSVSSLAVPSFDQSTNSLCRHSNISNITTGCCSKSGAIDPNGKKLDRKIDI